MSEKASYLELIARRNPIQHRTVKKPLCLDMSLWDAYLAAKQDHADAVKAARLESDTPEVRKYHEPSAVELAEERLKTAAEAMAAMSLMLNYRIPSSIEQDKMIAKLEKAAEENEEMVRGGTLWTIAYLAACFDSAETIDGTPVDDFTTTSLRNELQNLPMGLLLDMHGAVVNAIVASEFPTLPKL